MDVDFTVHELDEMGDDGPELQMALFKKTQQKSVPNVFVKQEHIGGNDDTQAAAKEGKLQELLGLQEKLSFFRKSLIAVILQALAMQTMEEEFSNCTIMFNTKQLVMIQVKLRFDELTNCERNFDYVDIRQNCNNKIVANIFFLDIIVDRTFQFV